MTVYQFEECTCDCHRYPNVYHCMPCCIECPICGMNVRLGYYDDHIQRHEERQAEIEEILDEPMKVTISVGEEKLTK